MFMSNDNEATAPNDVNDTQNVLIQPSQNNDQSQNDRQELLNRKDSMDEFTKDYDQDPNMVGGNILAFSAASKASVYFDAYTGQESTDKITEQINKEY